jgi:hypothetical protein
MQDLEAYDEADPFEAVKRAFKLIATAQTSTSALEARRMGFLRVHDRVSMNRDRLVADAKRRVLDLAPDYVAPQMRTIRALGKEGMGNLSYALFSFHEAGQASPYDVQVGHEIAYVLCGGDGPPRTGDRAGHPRPRARVVPQAPRQREDAGAHRVHAQDRQAPSQLRRPSMQDAVIVSAVRTAVAKGKADGALARAGVTPIDLAALVMKESALRGGVDPRHIDDVILGCAMPEASQGLNVARQAALKANFPVDASAATINRFCSSGLQSVASAVQAVMSGMQDVVVSGGVEMMSQVPMSGYHTRLHPALTESYIGMGFTAERVAERYDISREDQDAFAAKSQQNAARAIASGAFAEQIVPVPVQHVTWQGAKRPYRGRVRHRRAAARRRLARGLQKLRPAFKPSAAPSPPATRAPTPTAPPRWWS